MSRTGVWEGVWEWTVPLSNIPTSPPQPSTSLGTITDEDVKMGDPEETLQRGSRQSSQRSSQASSITTRQRRKRLSEETHQGPDTPPVSSAQSPSRAPYWEQGTHHSSYWEQEVFQVLRELLWPCG